MARWPRTGPSDPGAVPVRSKRPARQEERHERSWRDGPGPALDAGGPPFYRGPVPEPRPPLGRPGRGEDCRAEGSTTAGTNGRGDPVAATARRTVLVGLPQPRRPGP